MSGYTPALVDPAIAPRSPRKLQLNGQAQLELMVRQDRFGHRFPRPALASQRTRVRPVNGRTLPTIVGERTAS